MDILRDKRMVKSFMASLAINAVGVCLIGGSRVYNARSGTVQLPDTAATFHPVPITVATIPLTPLSTTQPAVKRKDVKPANKSLVKPDKRQRLPLAQEVKIAMDRQRVKDSKAHLKHSTAASTTAPPQMALATPQDFQTSSKPGSSSSTKTTGANASDRPATSGLRGHVNDKLFAQTLKGLERGGASDRGRHGNQTSHNKAPGDVPSSHNSVTGSRMAEGNTSSGDGKLPQQAHGSRPGFNAVHAGKESGQSQVKGGSLGHQQEEDRHDAEGHDEERSSQHHGSGTTTATTGQTEKSGQTAHALGTPTGSHVASEKPSETPSSPLRSTPGETGHTTGDGTAGSSRDRYIGAIYKGASPVNEQIHQEVALDPGNDHGAAVHALHLPKATDDTLKGRPGPMQTMGFTHSIPDNRDKSGFEILPSDLGSTSIFGEVPWGKPAPATYKDPGAGKDGMGLLGSYYVGKDFDQLMFQRADSNINFIWTFTGPGPLMPSRQPFSVRWTGELVAAYTEPYTIMTASDDGVRVYLNGDLIIDNWTVHAVTEDTATVNLVANQPNDIRVEYFEKNGMSNEIVKLYWESKDTPIEYIPENALIYPQPN